MMGGMGSIANVGIFIKLAVIIGAIVAVVMMVKALRKSAHEQERIAEKLDQIQRTLEKNSSNQ